MRVRLVEAVLVNMGSLTMADQLHNQTTFLATVVSCVTDSHCIYPFRIRICAVDTLQGRNMRKMFNETN